MYDVDKRRKHYNRAWHQQRHLEFTTPQVFPGRKDLGGCTTITLEGSWMTLRKYQQLYKKYVKKSRDCHIRYKRSVKIASRRTERWEPK